MRLPIVTLHQPWAHAIVARQKHIETRSWPAPATILGERIGIHAAARKPDVDGQRIGDLEVVRCSVTSAAGERSYFGVWNWATQAPGDGIGSLDDPVELVLGALVATATVSDSLPMTAERSMSGHILVEDEGLWIVEDAHEEDHGQGAIEVLQQGWRIDYERPYGHYEAGRFGWVLTDVKPCVPIPLKGMQGIWYADVDPINLEDR